MSSVINFYAFLCLYCIICNELTSTNDNTTAKFLFANLVKLCPNCHRMMKKGASSKEQQVRAIIKILNEQTEIFEFCSSYLNIDDINELSNKIWDLLG